MITKKAGTILVNLENKKIALVYRQDLNDYSFPKGHLEKGETLQECAMRETEEETERKNHLVNNKELDIVKYVTSKGENVELYMYLAVDDGPTEKIIADKDKEQWNWFDFKDVESNLKYENLREFLKKITKNVLELLGGENGKY